MWGGFREKYSEGRVRARKPGVFVFVFDYFNNCAQTDLVFELT